MDRLLGGGREHGRGVHIAGKTHQAGGQAHEAVHQCDELGHLRHLHLLGGIEADAGTDEEGDDDPGDAARADLRAEHGGNHRERHADHAEQVAAACGLGVGEPAQAEDEEDGGADIRDSGHA